MFDTMTMTKTLGALCGSLLVFLLGNWAAETVYTGGEGHSEEPQAYVIDTGAADAEAPAEDGPPFAELLASADPAAGEKIFAKCKSCHGVEGKDGTGPHLNGVVGRDIGSVPGFGYSTMLAGMEGNWDPDKLDGFIANPKSYAEGTKMSFAGLPKAEDRAAVVAYLETTK